MLESDASDGEGGKKGWEWLLSHGLDMLTMSSAKTYMKCARNMTHVAFNHFFKRYKCIGGL